MSDDIMSQPIVDWVWQHKYRLVNADGTSAENNMLDTQRRVCMGIYWKDDPEHMEAAFEELRTLRWSPGGRQHAGAGTGRQVTLINCFVSPTIQDSMRTNTVEDGLGIMDALEVAALSQQMGGGIGMAFGTIRPKGALVAGRAAAASGPVRFMDMWNSMCSTIMAAGERRGAMMATITDNHPDLEEFIEAKHQIGRLTNFNVSVLVSDRLMKAVADDADWDLGFSIPRQDGIHVEESPGWYVYKRLKARDLWDKIIRSTYDHAEPGVIFIDRVNKANNLWYCETIMASNPCGEQMLPPNGNCNLGAVNLSVMVRDPFTSDARVDFDQLRKTVAIGMRWLDNVIDVSLYPTPEQERESKIKRRTGLGITGLANMLQQLGLRYGSAVAVEMTERVMEKIRNAAYLASVELAKERGSFPAFEYEKYIKSEFVQGLPASIQEGIKNHGIRNSVLLTIAPTGTTSLYYGNVSSGLEPVFDWSYKRKTLRFDGSHDEFVVMDYGYRLYHKLMKAEPGSIKLPHFMVTAQDLTVAEHLEMQAACQKFIDSSVSKTINIPQDYSFEDFKRVYAGAYIKGLKGCTTYRPNPESGRGSVIESVKPESSGTGADIVGEAAPPLVSFSAKVPRPGQLPGTTYKVKWPKSEFAFYVTINDYHDNGTMRPFEIFINSKSVQHQEWITAITRTISAVFRKGGDVSFLVEELEQVHSAEGGMWIDGKYVPSLVSMIGSVVRTHLESINAVTQAVQVQPQPAGTGPGPLDDQPPAWNAQTCPQCQAPALVRMEGCAKCRNCGYSNC